MGQNKLESQIKEKLNAREIQPSAQAWDRLDAMLSVVEEKKTKRSFGWLYIAAGITVLLIAGMFFFSQNSTDTINQDSVVDSEVKEDTIQNEQNNFQAPINAIEKKQNQVAESTEIQNLKSNSQSNIKEAVSVITREQSPNWRSNQKSNQEQSNNPLINRDKRIEFQNSSDVAVKDLPKIDTRTKIVVGGNDIPSSGNTTKIMSDEDLLASLDNAGKKVNTKSNVKVDAGTLLSQVDGELEFTFREKIINKISKNYKEVKVALSNRNNE
jgi:low affinity Fe/Cu permease